MQPIRARLAPELRTWLALIAVGLLLSSCAPVTTPPKPAPETPVPRAEPESRAPETEDFFRRVAPAAAQLDAPESYLRRAESAASPAREDLLILAARAYLESGRAGAAATVLKRIDPAALPPSYHTRWQLAQAEVELATGRYTEAFQRLVRAGDGPPMAPDLLQRLYLLRAQAQLGLGRDVAAARELIARERLLADPAAVLANRQQLWAVLQDADPGALSAATRISSDTVLAGWSELALISRQHAADPAALSAAVDAWQGRYPGHPAPESLLRALGGPAPDIGRPGQVALLLPLASEFGRAAQAVHDGFMAAAAADRDPRAPTIRVYDTGGEPDLAPSYYDLAVREGADFVVGPLGREAVHAVARKPRLQVPTLLLGSVEADSDVPPSVYQLSLEPEQEARQVALRAWLDGHRVAAVLAPASEWGTRMRSAFVDRWERLGGVVAATANYAPGAEDYSAPIRTLLNVDRSEARADRLSRILGTRLEFEPRRRQDIEFIFLAANVRDGRLLKPQISFHQGHDVPVYATSHIYAGSPSPVNDADLEGIRFADMPWMLAEEGRVSEIRQRLRDEWPGAGTPLERLYALGIDAYRVIPELARLQRDGMAVYHGVTADLTMDGQGRLQRRLYWARFEDGSPVMLDRFSSRRGMALMHRDSAGEGQAEDTTTYQ